MAPRRALSASAGIQASEQYQVDSVIRGLVVGARGGRMYTAWLRDMNDAAALAGASLQSCEQERPISSDC